MSGADGRGGEGQASAVTRALRVVIPDFVRARFALKFVIVLLVMGLVIVGVGFLATDAISAQTEQRTVEEYESLAAQQGNLVEQWLNGRQEIVRTISDDQVWTSDNTSRMNRQLQQNVVPTMSENVFGIRVINHTANGDDVFIASSTGGAGLPVEGSRFEWAADQSFDDVNDVNVSAAYRAGTTGTYVVAFASPTAGGDRTFVVEMRLTSIARQLETDRVRGGFTYVVNNDGVVMIDQAVGNASVQLHEITQQYPDMEAVRESRELQAESGVHTRHDPTAGLLNESYAVAYSSVIVPGKDRAWHVMVHAPRNELFGFSNRVSRTGLVVTGGLGVVIVLIGAVLGFNTSRSIERLTAKTEEMERGNLDVDVHSGRIDSIGRLYDGFASMRDALREQIHEAEQARKEAEVSRAEALEMNEYLQEKAEEYSEIMGACARGNLTQRMEPEGENEAMDQIAMDFNEMITELEMTTGQLKTFAEEVEESGRSVQQSAETVRDASEQVADSVQKISDDAYEGKERLQAISEEMDEVASQLEALADEYDVDVAGALDSIREVANMVEAAAELAEETMTESENVAGAAEEQAAELNEVSSRAEELTRYAQYLGDGLGNFETEEEHEFVFQTGAGGPSAGGPGTPTGGETGDESGDGTDE